MMSDVLGMNGGLSSVIGSLGMIRRLRRPLDALVRLHAETIGT
jgi:hypothetical protein